MKKLVSILAIFFFTTFTYSQNTFWFVKGGTGNEVDNYRSAHLDTTAGGNLLCLYNTTSTPSEGDDIVMEVWPKGSNSPVTELFLGYPNYVRLNNLQIYQDEVYLSTAMVNPAVSSNSRAGLIRLDTNGVYLSSFMHNGSQMGTYGNAYQCLFLQDTAFLFGQARSSAGSGNREDFYWAKLDLNTNSSLAAKRWNGYGTERIRHAAANKTGDSIFAAAYSYSTPGNTRPILFHFDKQGNIVQQYSYTPSNSSFFHIEHTTDSLTLMGSVGGNNAMRVRMGRDGQPSSSLQYSSSNSGVSIGLYGAKSYGNQRLLFGYLQNESMGNGGEEGFLMSIDAQGNVLGWQSGEKTEKEVLEETIATQFKAFPNPFGERLNIDLADPADQLDLALVNQFGRLVHKESLSLAGETKHEWSLPSLASGIYVLQVHAYHEGQA